MFRCLNCFDEYEETQEICPFCGAEKNLKPAEPIHLLPGTILAKRYMIGKSIGAGGFGIIYQSWDMKFDKAIAIKEFYPLKLVSRAAGTKDVIVNSQKRDEFAYRKNRFLAEARAMAKYSTHPEIPNVFDFLEENNTVYFAMELLEGMSLNYYAKEHGEKFDRDFAVYIVNEVGKALKLLHKDGIVHKDVAPDNIFICSGRELKIKLLDLGAAKLSDNTDNVVDIVTKPGYSPLEQYEKNVEVGPDSDVYSLGATFYYLLTGKKPDESTDRKIEDLVQAPRDIDPSIPENLSNAVMKAIAVDRHLRFKTIDDFLKAVNGEKKVLSLKIEQKLQKRRKIGLVLGALFSVAVISGCVFWTYQQKKAAEYLSDTAFEIWYVAADGSDKQSAIENVVSDFMQTFPNVAIEAKAFSEDEYASVLMNAADTGTLPALFESTGMDSRILEKAADVTAVLKSEQARDCLFLEQYHTYYSAEKQLPLAVQIPIAAVITSGNVSTDYTQAYFSSVSDFGEDAVLAVDDSCRDLLSKNYDLTGTVSEALFLNNENNTSSILLTSTMAINSIRNLLTNYEKVFVYPDIDTIHCGFTYEWSLGNVSENEKLAAERLLSWMLGNVYQNSLMISLCSDGEIPLNKTCFEEKLTHKYFSEIGKIYDHFVFD